MQFLGCFETFVSNLPCGNVLTAVGSIKPRSHYLSIYVILSVIATLLIEGSLAFLEKNSTELLRHAISSMSTDRHSNVGKPAENSIRSQIADRFLSGCYYYDTSSLDRIAGISATTKGFHVYPCLTINKNKKKTEQKKPRSFDCKVISVEISTAFVLQGEAPGVWGSLVFLVAKSRFALQESTCCHVWVCAARSNVFLSRYTSGTWDPGKMQGVDDTKIWNDDSFWIYNWTGHLQNEYWSVASESHSLIPPWLLNISTEIVWGELCLPARPFFH